MNSRIALSFLASDSGGFSLDGGFSAFSPLSGVAPHLPLAQVCTLA